MTTSKYLDVLAADYLQRYIPAGGSAVKFVVVQNPSVAAQFCQGLRGIADAENHQWLHLCASVSKLHMMHELLFAVSRSLDWDLEVLEFIRHRFLEGVALPITPGRLNINSFASSTGVEVETLRQSFKKHIREQVSQDYSYSTEFRTALARLCLGQLEDADGPLSPYSELIKEWLNGTLTKISGLKEALLFQRIQRNNARHLLYSTLHFLRKCGHRGVLLALDISRYFEITKMRERDSGRYYTYSATLDLYELLRQCIDDGEELEGTMIVVIAPNSFLTDERRSIERYQALKMRIWNDVRVKGVENPVAPMVTLS